MIQIVNIAIRKAMRNKFLFKALAVSLLLTLFSCSDGIKIEQGTKSAESSDISTVSEYKERTITLSLNSKLHKVITPTDTFLIFSRSRSGAVLLKQSPVR